MDLKDFVVGTLTQIVDGVREAQSRTQHLGAKVNPHISTEASLVIRHGIFYADGQASQLVHFDVALTAMEGTGTKGGIGVVAGVFTLGSTGQSQAENTSVSRVKFSVPLVLPISPSARQ